MRLFCDLNLEQIIVAPGVQAPLLGLDFKRSGWVRVEIQFVRNGQVIELPVDATGAFAFKPVGKYDLTPTVMAPAWVKVGTGTETYYVFTFSFLTSELNSLFYVDENSENDVATVLLNAEMAWTLGGNTLKSQTIPATVHNDIIRGGESLPTLPALIFGVFLPGITRILGGTATDLDGVPVANLQTGYIIQLLVDVAGELSWVAYRLDPGAADPENANEVAPPDYDPDTNDRHWVGAKGPAGPTGFNGTDGADGTNGNTIIPGIVDPEAGDGVDGDFYINTVTHFFFGPKAAGAWPAGVSMVGGDGGDGGTIWGNGDFAPDDGDGSLDGDYWLNTDTGEVSYKADGTYSVIMTIIGAPGSVWLNGSGVPDIGDGVDGDYYIDTDTGDVYFKSSGGGGGT